MRLVKLVFLFCIILGCSEKSNREKPLPKITDRWEVISGKYGNKPMSIRVNRGLSDVIGHKDLQHQIGITVPILNPMKNGLPDEEEEKKLKEIEKVLASELTESGLAVFASVITTHGEREYIFYTGNPKAAKASFKRLEEAISTHTIQLNIQRDKKWIVYKWFSR